MKIKNKGKVHPSPSSSSSSSSDGDFLDVLNCLPAAIMALVAVLTAEDREVLAFMMRRSMETSEPEKKPPKRSSKKAGAARATSSGACGHEPPALSFTCFDCYVGYWDRWNSSPHRELIHQAIEAFEELPPSVEKSGKSAKGKKKEKIARRPSEKLVIAAPPPELPPPVAEDDSLGVAPATSGEAEEEEEEAARVIVPSPAPSNHKGLARKVWPDVLGLFNSRLWSLWGPN